MTGAARGRGRSHALRLAWEGADIVLVDLCDNIPSCDYPLATSEDLDRTATMIEKLDRKALVYRCDVCDRLEMEIAVDTAVRQLGALDIVVANAAIVPIQPDAPIAAFIDTFDVDFIGVVNTFSAAVPRLVEGSSLIASGPTCSPQGPFLDRPQGLGGAAYELAQSMVSQYVKTLAKQLAPQGIRVNTVSGAEDAGDVRRAGRLHRPVMLDVDSRGNQAGAASLSTMLWPAATWADTDASAAVAFLAADESRTITGRHVTVDAGSSLN
ncbi:SDR family oxidoreductase [Mycobacterium marseillense]|uniref:SDR family oxidoreductase n=1 Tax=Mycobacterium avium complex (MAC) TaxID=120793 RepID=UPI000C2BFB50|nr:MULTISPECIES: SDR family oxidoreductase [Mycobacterium avium complex (MAC)]MDM3973485.1 SDR family oxidoreductase [Mycobacterium marseillense]